MAKLSEKEYDKLYIKFSLIAKSKNGKLLSPKFNGMTKDHLWLCKKHNYIWKAKEKMLPFVVIVIIRESRLDNVI